MDHSSPHQVVMVDDDHLVLKAFARQFQEMFDVRTFTSAKDMLAEMGSLSPSLFIIDWLMPEMDGISLCREIRRQARFDLVPIAFYTAIDPNQKHMEEAFAAGAQTFISKEGSISTTLLQMRTLIDNFEKLLHTLQQQKIMLSVLKHDMSNLLTGVITGLEVLALNKVFADPVLHDQLTTILTAGSSLRHLFEDLNEVLVLPTHKKMTTIRPVPLAMILSDLQATLTNTSRPLTIAGQTELIIPCIRRSLGRCLFYLVLFFERQLKAEDPLTIETIPRNNGFDVTLTGPGNLADRFAVFGSDRQTLHTLVDRHDVLQVQYIKNVLTAHHADLAVAEENGRTVVSFHLAGLSEE